MKVQFLLICYLIICISITAAAQKIQKASDLKKNDLAKVESEVRTFFNEYGEDLRQHRREAIANRYDTAGYYRMGNGNKAFISFEQSKNRYLNRWTGPKDFQWKNLSIEMLSSDAALVVGQFDWKLASGDSATYSYSGILKKKNGQWRIRMEDESSAPSDFTTTTISGDRSKPGAFKYIFNAKAGASIAAHRHSVDMHITVRSGKKFILMGDLLTARVQIFEANSKLVIPANTWHVEWWETDTIEEIEGIGSMLTERASPATPRKQ
jgi:hypothetical protein